jgi:hypothetical protein
MIPGPVKWRHEPCIVIGFCDVPGSIGKPSNTYFREADYWRREQVPTINETREYAASRGYFPSGKKGAHPAKCDPIYLRP